VGIQVAHSSQGAPPLLVRTVRNTHRLESGDVYLIGRNPEAAIELADARVSWVHAALLVEDGVWVLQDPAPGFGPSRNGTFYQGNDRVSRIEITGPMVVHFGNPEDGPVLRFELQQLAAREPREPREEMPPQSNEGDTTFLPGVYRDPTSRFRLQSKVIKIGRRPDNDVVLTDLGVSKLHAELRESSPGHYQIIDLGSHNGTFVNGVRVNQAELSETDIVSIGHATFRLVGGELREYIDEGNVSFEAHELQVIVSDGGKQKVLLSGITFPLAERSMMAVIGPAGAGKSTLLNALTGKRPADKGEVLYDFRNLYDSYDELKFRIGLVPQQSVTHDQLTAKTALGYAAELRFPPDAGEAELGQRVDEVLDELSMTPHANTRIDRLSGGQQKRVNIGLELLTKPSLLFLDEPTSPLDPHLKRDLFTQMRRMADPDAPAGQSVVVITHDVEKKLLDLCDRLIVLMPGGKMAYFGPPAEGLRYFGADDWADVFQSFADQSQRDWSGEFRGSAEYVKYVANPISERERAQQTERRREEEAAAAPRQRGLWSQVGTMARRYRRVMVADRVFLVTTILTPIVLGLLVRVMPSPQGLTGSLPSHPNGNALQLLMILVMSAVLSGTALSIREFIKEREIFERERMAGLSATAYLLSKVVVLSIICVLSVLLIALIGLAGRKLPSSGALIPGTSLIEIFVGLAVLCVVSMLLGLAVSTLVTKSDQTMPLLVGVTMINVALSGGMFPLTGLGSWISLVAPARAGLAAIASTVNLNAMNGELLPQPGGGAAAQPDALWAHTGGQWITDIAIVLIIGVIAMIIARVRLGAMGPRRRK
jgi:ABC transport system ATP-binding/permease protein